MNGQQVLNQYMGIIVEDELNLKNVNPSAVLNNFKNNLLNEYDVVDGVSWILYENYRMEYPYLNTLLIRETILSIHGQSRPRNESPAYYAIELLDKAKQNKLSISFNDQSLFSALQFEHPRIER